MLNLDTDILLHGLTGNLVRLENVLLSNDTWSISAIVLWEFAKLAEPGRIDVDLDDPVLTRTLASIQTWPVTLDICRTIKTLDFDSDPRRRDYRRHEHRAPPPACDPTPPDTALQASATSSLNSRRPPANVGRNAQREEI
jgi:PIN domain nuclease of toxin-antitoxin system